jgi:hypothetical protein
LKQKKKTAKNAAERRKVRARHREATAKGRVLEKVNKKHADLKHCLVKMGYT